MKACGALLKSFVPAALVFFANTDMAEEHFGKPHFLFREFTRFSPSKSEFKSNELQAKTKRLVI